MLKKPQVKGCFIQGQFLHGHSQDLLSVRHKHNGNSIAEMYKASAYQVELALDTAAEGAEALCELNQKDMKHGFSEFARQLAAHKSELVDIISTETGKPEGYANVEVDRGVNVLTKAAQENGTVLSNTEKAGLKAKSTLIISPFSLPLDQMLGTICKEVAQGRAVILKPSSKSPLTALFLASILAKTTLPTYALQVINCDRKITELLMCNSHIASVVFTGSEKVASRLSQIVFDKELRIQTSGGNRVIFNSSQASDIHYQHAAASNEINKIDKFIDNILDQDTPVLDDLSLNHLMLNESPFLTSAALRHMYA